ncbi:hypothetical protein WJX81_007759 [Elliptochloris bilobata]|uniref:Phospholipid:diacylglycerol acyltransferase n=1 Tax=Elliptochloris bilobata TaxID=381761 RepID=A0AAW1QLM2_9CHLO
MESTACQTDDSLLKGGHRKKKPSAFWWWALAVLVLSLFLSKRKMVQRRLEPLMEPMVERLQSMNINVTQLELPHGVRLPAVFRQENPPRPGRKLRKRGLGPKHPVIIVPGFVTSGLELWHGVACAIKYFRQRIWGSMGMTQSLIGDKDCWLQHMALDSATGLDPEGVALRATEGLFGVDYFFPGYFVWAKLIEALADLGYDANNIIGETYDWRLAVPNMERRDGYFTRLKVRVETTHQLHGEKVVVVSHSWGDNVFRAFMRWAAAGDPEWVERHVAAYVNIAGPTLGVPKAITALLSGETRDTAELGLIGAYLSDNFVPRNQRVKLFRTWGSGIGMLPAGGTAAWGNATWAPDDTPDMAARNLTYGVMLTEVRVDERAQAHGKAVQPAAEKGPDAGLAESVRSWVQHLLDRNDTDVDLVIKKHDVREAVDILVEDGGARFKEQVQTWGAVYEENAKSCDVDPEDPATWHVDPLRCPLPHAPSLQLFCLYGVGKPTERAYQYLNLQTEELLEKSEDADREQPQNEVFWKIDLGATDKKVEDAPLDRGVRASDGDGTVPLLSLGALCARHWREPRLNPSGMRVVTREFPHEPFQNLIELRGGPKSADHVDILGNAGGGPKSADHVDILGNAGVLEDIGLIAAGHGAELQDRFASRVRDIAAAINV